MEKFWTWVEKIPLYKWFNKHPFFGKFINREVLSYLIFGVLTTVVAFVTFYLPDKLFLRLNYQGIVHYITHSPKNYSYVESNIISWICAVSFAFVTNKLFVFESHAKDPKTVMRELVSFAGGRVVTLFVDMGVIFVLVTLLSVNSYLAKILDQAIVAVLNYFISKIFVFRKKTDKGE